jgi:hypothetical protein
MRHLARTRTFLLHRTNYQAQPQRLRQQSRSSSAHQIHSSCEFKPFGGKSYWHSICALARASTCNHVEKTKQFSDQDSSGRLEKVIRGILHYCVRYPDAKDTPEGILKWWLAEGRGEWGKEDIQKALDMLTSKGWLLKRKTRQSEEIYGLNKEHLQEITDFMMQAKWH